MKLGTDRAVTRVLHEGITTMPSFEDFDRSSIKALANKNCKETIPAIVADVQAGITGEVAIPGTVLPTQYAVRLMVACNAVKYYMLTGRTPTLASMHHTNVLSKFKIDFEACEQLKEQEASELPDVEDSDNDRKVIKWAPILLHCMPRTCGIKGPLAYVLRENVEVPDEATNPLMEDEYFGSSGSLQEELILRLTRGDALYRFNNKIVYMSIEKVCRGTSVESTVKAYRCTQNGRGAYFTLIDHHTGDSNYRSIMKK